MAFNSKEFSLFPLCKVYIVLGACIGPVRRPQHWASYAACSAWNKEKRKKWKLTFQRRGKSCKHVVSLMLHCQVPFWWPCQDLQQTLVGTMTTVQQLHGSGQTDTETHREHAYMSSDLHTQSSEKQHHCTCQYIDYFASMLRYWQHKYHSVRKIFKKTWRPLWKLVDVWYHTSYELILVYRQSASSRYMPNAANTSTRAGTQLYCFVTVYFQFSFYFYSMW